MFLAVGVQLEERVHDRLEVRYRHDAGP